MSTPHVKLVPLRPAICSDRDSILDLIVRILVPRGEVPLKRPMINLGLVMDCSNSMTGEHFERLQQAIQYAVRHLQVSDRVSVIQFSDQARVLVPSIQVIDKRKIVDTVAQIKPKSSTALYAGWVTGATQVGQHFQTDALNRVIILSDGFANIGETNADTIALDVSGLAQRGVSTTTVGVGHRVQTDLLAAIAWAGGGHYHELKTVDTLQTIFQTELTALMPTIGYNVHLIMEPQADVELLDAFASSAPEERGVYALPDLVAGNPQDVVLRLKVSPSVRSRNLCRFRLEWTALGRSHQQMVEVMLTLPAVPFAQLGSATLNPQVQRRVARMMQVRARQEQEVVVVA
jgi:Ca-activated chloride channel homolog